jgi:tetratricopeptide (TPR) repeat protein
MTRTNRYDKLLKGLLFVLVAVVTFAMLSCSSSRKASTTKGVSAKSMVVPAVADSLSPELQRKFDYFYLEALRLKGNKSYDAAFEMLQHCLSINPTSSAALYEIGQYYLTLKQYPQSINAFSKAVQYEPSNYWYNQGLANLYQQVGDSVNTVNTLEQMADRFPTNRDPLLSLIDLYHEQENYPKVIDALNRLEKVMGKNEQISMEKFRSYVQMNDYTNAFKEMESLSQEYPAENRYKVLLGDVYYQNGKKEEAYNIYKKVLATDPDNAMAMLSLAGYYQSKGDKEKYEHQLDTLLLDKKIPADSKVDVMRQLITEYEEQHRDSTQIIRLFDTVIKEDTDDVQIPMLYANYLITKGNKEASYPLLERVLRHDPTNNAARLMLLNTAIQKEDQKKVIQLCEPGIEATPDVLELYFYLAVAYNEANRTDDALSVCRKALLHVRSDSKPEVISDFYAMIGDFSHKKGLNKEAFAAYDSSLVYNADNIEALNNYAYYLSVVHQQLDKAEEMSYKTVKAEPNNATYLDTYAWILFIKGNYTQARIYIDNAMKNGGESSSDVVEHCGDIHAMTDDITGAVKYWTLSQKLGNKSKVLKQKIVKKKYIKE